MGAQQSELVVGEPCARERAEPLRVRARLAEGIVMRYPVMLDALLMRVVADQHQLLAPTAGARGATIEIPIARADRGDFHLCSEGVAGQREYELRHRNRRPVVYELWKLGSPKIKRVSIAVGANKGYRVPYELQLLKDGLIEWWCLGDRLRIAELLAHVHYLGRFRGVGHGRLDLWGDGGPWRVEPCEPWEGFPVVRDGMPLRPLPQDWPGLIDPPLSYRVLSPPYWDLTREQLLAVPQ